MTSPHRSEVWAFDVDGCLVDSLTGSSLRPYAVDVLDGLRAAGRTLVLWSAGGEAHARSTCARHGLTHFSGIYAKGDRDAQGRPTTGHLPTTHVPDVAVDDRPGDGPAGARLLAVPPYMTPDPGDRGLVPLLAVTSTLLQEVP